MPDFSSPDILLSLILFMVRILQPFFALLILYHIFSSMRNHQREEQPLVVLDNLVTRDRIPVIYWENSIGRSKTSDIMLADQTVSRNHAVLYRREEGWMIADTGSKSGILLNGHKVEKRATLHVGDQMTLGTTTLVLQRAERPVKRRGSWFFDKRKKPSISPSLLLFFVSFFHLVCALQVCFAADPFSGEPLLPFAAVTAAAWILFFFTRTIFHRVSFELETFAIFLSGIGVALISGVDVKNTVTQVAALVIGMCLFCFLIWFIGNPDRVMKWRLPLAILGLGLLAANLVLGTVVNGSQNWIYIGPFSIQPSEFVKIIMILVGTSTLNCLQTGKNMTEFIVFSALCIGALFLMGDYGTACIFFLTFLIVAFIRSGNIRTIIFLCSAAVLGVFVILQLKPYIANRFAAWGKVWEYADGLGYQQTRVLSYSASGGLFGMGLGQGNLKYVAASTSDLVFGMICEERGVLCALIIAASLAALALYAVTVSSRSRSTLYSIASCSAAGMMVFQACLNIFGATDILPLTGVTLPFISMGGSSLMSVWALLAFIKASDERTYAARRRKT